MRLLLVTQAVDIEDPYLGFFTRWIEEMAPRFESIEVVCLKSGTYALPANVRVHSLDKERGRVSRLRYAWRFLALAWKLRRGYDAVLVHMNQEYVLLGGFLWKLLGKRIYMWRNHHVGSAFTRIAASFCTKVFTTSRHSYTAKYRKTMLMPVGVDTERFHPDERVARKKHSILFLARMSPSKDPLMLLEALHILDEKGIAFTATFAGPVLPEHESYYRSVIARAEAYGLSDRVAFLPGIPNHELPDLYRAHEAFVNCARSGMFDKTIFEAAASGCFVLALSDDFAAEAGESFHFRNAGELAGRLEAFLAGRGGTDERLRETVQKNSLRATMEALASEIA